MGDLSGPTAVFATGSVLLASITVTDLVTAMATAVTAAVSLALGGFAFLQLRDARQVRHEETRPYVQIDFEVKQHMVYLRLQNLGRTAARNLSFKSVPPLESSMDRGDRHGPSRFLDRQWPSFAPGKDITSIFDSAITTLADHNARPTGYKVTASYDDSTGMHFDDVSVLDIESYRGRHFTREKTIDDVAQALERIQESLQAMQHHRSALVVYTKTLDEVLDEEERDREESLAKQSRGTQPNVAKNPSGARTTAEEPQGGSRSGGDAHDRA